MAVGRTNAAAKGGGIDYNSKPQINFDGKWSGWYIEYYDGVPYWEAQFFSSGTLNVSGNYTADAHGIGGGGCSYDGSGASGGDRGATQIVTGITLNGEMAISIGAGAFYTLANGGTTMLANLLSCAGGKTNARRGGLPSATRGDKCYRFGDAGHSAEQGADGAEGPYASSVGAGGWMHWRAMIQSGEGYGAGGGIAYPGSSQYYDLAGHSGLIVIRIAV